MLAVATGRFTVDVLATYNPDSVLPDLGDTDAVVAVLAASLAAR